ncbi:DUF1572 domain-containing protein [Polaribacter sp. Z022]|uniref:DUF1572 domain-containing protein n=1 Tax=Polaribacter sp. Z022 TaxID=2927125 RepID=UPI00202145A1|nr:DUF1572 domain-containing protein [Polaribacter sp. Z022]
MKKNKELANRFREVFLDGTWVANTNYKKVLEAISYKKATTKVNSLNTIAVLTFHINYYVAGVLNVFEGGKLEIRDKYSFDAPKITSESEWISLKNTLFTNAEKFANYIESLSETELESVFVDEKYGTYYRNIEGMIEHSYYHLVQISLINKLID